MLPNVIITLLSCVTHVTSQFQCQGTCYSGSFPKNNDVINGKHLRGHSYKNITTDVPQTCFSSCINDCRCKAFQMKDVRCELLDEDKSSKTADFVSETGYVYYNLQQTIYKGPSGVCHNGCCRTQPCMNGGTCAEHCENPKQKFTCKCPDKYHGKVCEKNIFYSCMDVLKTSVPGTIPANGTYTITRSDTKATVPVYCAFDSPNQAWTLIESFSLGNKQLFKTKAFHQDYPRNESTPPHWQDYRLSLTNMQYIQSKATMFRATCDYQKRSSLTPDYLLGFLTEFDIVSSEPFSAVCKKFLHVNIIGQECFNCTARSFNVANEHFHIDTNIDIPGKMQCDFRPTNNVKEADNFGFYSKIDRNSKCTATQQSTTQWWLGGQR